MAEWALMKQRLLNKQFDWCEIKKEKLALLDTDKLFSEWLCLHQTVRDLNHLILRYRSLGIGAVLAVYSTAIGFASAPPSSSEFCFLGMTLGLGGGLAFAGVILMAILFVNDRFYYYGLLLGVVDRTEEIEYLLAPSDDVPQVWGSHSVSKVVSRRRSNLVVLLIYVIPIILGLVLGISLI